MRVIQMGTVNLYKVADVHDELQITATAFYRVFLSDKAYPSNNVYAEFSLSILFHR